MKKIVLMIMSAMILVSMVGCGKQNDNLTKEEFDNSLENEKSDSQDDINTQDSKKEETFEEKEITLNQKDKEILEDLLCELCDFQDKKVREKKDNSISIIPDNDEDKVRLIYIMFCDTDLNPSLDYHKYKGKTNGTLEVPLQDMQNILNEAISTKLSNPEVSNYYKDGIFVFSMGNRGSEYISGNISKVIQTSKDTVKIEGTVKNTCEQETVYKKNIIATAKINGSSIFGGYSLINVKYDTSNSEGVSNNGDYILQDSDKKYLTDNDIKDLSKDQLALARNEIYARHGYVFKENKFKSYFESKSWYKKNTAFTGDDSQLNDCEKANVKIIKTWEDKK